MSEMNNLDKYSIAYDKIVNDTDMLPSTRLLALKLQHNPYMTVGDFLNGLSDDELFTLLEIADQLIINFEDCVHGRDVVLISEMLVRAEGLVSITEEEVAHRTNALCSFLACEGLARRGLVKIYRERMSFGEDMLNAVVVEKLPGVDYGNYGDY